MIGPSSSTSSRSSTISRYPVADTPSLVGYWPCDDGSGLTLRDLSKYGHHLKVQLGQTDTPDSVWLYPKSFTPSLKTRAYRSATGTPLDTQSRVVVFSMTITRHVALDDIDMGTANDNFNAWSAAPYTGFSVSGTNGSYACRVKGSVQYQGTPGLISTSESLTLCGAFVPGNRLLQSTSLSGPVETVAAPLVAALVAQNGIFALQGNNTPSGVSNYQLWSFLTEPPSLNTVLPWMSVNPGLVPPWWMGL